MRECAAFRASEIHMAAGLLLPGLEAPSIVWRRSNWRASRSLSPGLPLLVPPRTRDDLRFVLDALKAGAHQRIEGSSAANGVGYGQIEAGGGLFHQLVCVRFG